MRSKTKSTVTQSLVYDKAGNLISYDDGSGSAVTYGYDERNQATSLALPGGSCTTTPTSQCLTFAYDANQKRTATSYPNGVTERVNYDDKTGQLLRIYAEKPGTTLTDFTYTYTDPSSSADTALRQTVKDLAQNTTTYTYDPSNGPAARTGDI